MEKELVFCQARAEFKGLSEDEVWDAIEGDNYGESPITAEVTRLGAEFLARFKDYADERGGVPAGALLNLRKMEHSRCRKKNRVTMSRNTFRT